MNLYDQVQELKRENDSLNRRIEELEKIVSNIKGKPIIQGYIGQIFTLNSSLNVVELLKRIKILEDEVL